jgi:hypothetical protein
LSAYPDVPPRNTPTGQLLLTAIASAAELSDYSAFRNIIRSPNAFRWREPMVHHKNQLDDQEPIDSLRAIGGLVGKCPTASAP